MSDESPTPNSTDAANPDAAKPTAGSNALPPPTLPTLISVLGTQALIAMGQIPDPASGKPAKELDQARHFIDLLAMLETKTAGNRTPEESEMLDEIVHQLRMMFVAETNSAAT